MLGVPVRIAINSFPPEPVACGYLIIDRSDALGMAGEGVRYARR